MWHAGPTFSGIALVPLRLLRISLWGRWAGKRKKQSHRELTYLFAIKARLRLCNQSLDWCESNSWEHVCLSSNWRLGILILRGAPACFCHLKLCHQSNSHFCPRLCWESSLTAVSNCEARFNVYRLEKEGEQHLSICATGVLFQDGTLTPSILSDRASEFAPGSRSFILVLWCTRGKNMTRLQIRLRLLLKIPWRWSSRVLRTEPQGFDCCV